MRCSDFQLKAFVTKPLFLIALLLFVTFITDIGHGYAVFAAYASIFFGIVVAQFNFRTKIPSHQLVYFENMLVSVLYLKKMNMLKIQEYCLTFVSTAP